MKKTFLGHIIGCALIVSSCSTPQDITYFPHQATGTTVKAADYLDIRVKPEDKLSIVVSTQDPALSSLFNLVTAQNSVGASSHGGGMIGASSGGGNGQMAYYTVNPDGRIDFPVLGNIEIGGLTRYQIAQKIKDELTSRNLVKEPIVTVEFANTRIAVLGEVKSPGLYTFNEDHLTIIDAIANAGDLTINGLRENILVMRNIGDGEYKSYRVSLLDAQQLASTPVFYLQQDDVIYVEPNDKVKRETTPNGNSPFTPSFWISLGSTAITVATLIITLSR